ncbi:sugar phosphate isomerase/epimerase [Meiothermus sp.]|uniref:sugar phosphate isomerase/epimerase family protein n=1 Tax=Meiothermus sp. TaxID=1955249 RepID=UPI0021DF2E7E|nr:sugar phosphate isomerase/epimerase family protein [Meiothermus sp.]GIW35220.1 MAG: hypothetical protein KatS3mg072_2553 [Meiothermus sp.]
MTLGFRPPKDPTSFLDYAERLEGRYGFIEIPGSAVESLAQVSLEARAMGYDLTLHARYQDIYPASPEPTIRETSLRILEEDLIRAARMGAMLVNVHAGNIPWTDYPPSGLSPAHQALREAEQKMREEALERALEGFSRLTKLASSLGVRLALENLPAPQEFPRTPGEMTQFLEVPDLYFCLDLGHARMAGEPTEGFLEALGERLVHVHAHTNDGYFDLHLPPASEEVVPFAGRHCTLLVELPPRGVEEYLELYQNWALAGLVPEAIGGKVR